MAGRTLTQHAVPTTFGLKAAQWLQGVLDAREDLRALRFPVQVGGAAGTLAAATELAGDADAALFLVAETARLLGLEMAPSWHTSRAPVTRYADALVRATDAMGHIANDVLLLARPEIAELAEPAVEGRGGSSTMPQKANPVLSVLVRRAALSAPGQAAQLHLAAATTLDERPDGSWHTEWSTLASLSRHALTAAAQTAELVGGLHVDTGRMASVVKQQSSALLAEQRSMRSVTGRDRDGPGLRSRPLPRRGRPARRTDPAASEGGPVSVPTITAARLTGAAHRAELPLLVLGPSLGTSAATLWTECARGLTDHFDVVAWDLPGHGYNHTVREESFTVAELAQGVLRVVDEILEQRAEVGGSFAYAGDSVGGCVGLQLLLDHPERVDLRRAAVHRREDR